LPTIPYTQLTDFQGDLKTITDEALEKLKKSIIQFGVRFSKKVWQHNATYFTLDGHQTKKALESLETEGWEIPEIPVERIEARNKADAHRLLLLINSQYGAINPETRYLNEFGIQPKFMDLVHIPFLEQIPIELAAEVGQSVSGGKGIAYGMIVTIYDYMIDSKFRELNEPIKEMLAKLKEKPKEEREELNKLIVVKILEALREIFPAPVQS
jgi:hypothetical protein